MDHNEAAGIPQCCKAARSLYFVNLSFESGVRCFTGLSFISFVPVPRTLDPLHTVIETEVRCRAAYSFGRSVFLRPALRTTVHIHLRPLLFHAAICARLQMRLPLVAGSVDVKRTIRRKDSRALAGYVRTYEHERTRGIVVPVAAIYSQPCLRPFMVDRLKNRLCFSLSFSPPISASPALPESSFRDRPISLPDQRETSTGFDQVSFLSFAVRFAGDLWYRNKGEAF